MKQFLFLILLLMPIARTAAHTNLFIPQGWRLSVAQPSPFNTSLWPWSPIKKSALTFHLASFISFPDSEGMGTADFPYAMLLRKNGALSPGVLDLAELPRELKQGLIGDAAELITGHSASVLDRETLPLVSSLFQDNHMEHHVYLLNEDGMIAELKLQMRPTIEIVDVSLLRTEEFLKIQFTYKETTGPYSERRNHQQISFSLLESALHFSTRNMNTSSTTHIAYAWAVAALRSVLFGLRVQIDDSETFLSLVDRWSKHANSHQLLPENLYARFFKIMTNATTRTGHTPDGTRVQIIELLKTRQVCKWITDYGLPK